MSKLVVTGGHRLRGRVRAGGRKNSAVAILPATLLADGPSIIENLPDIRDVAVYCDILRALGARVTVERRNNGSEGLRATVDPSGLKRESPPEPLVNSMRASSYLIGVLLARHGRADVPFPGGCDIGSRPIDQHVKGLTALGAGVKIEHGVVTAEASRLTGAPVYLDVVSVGATINIMLAAIFAEGTTVIENAAKEPHVVDLANYLNAAGGNVKGAGTDIIKVTGVRRLNGVTHSVIPDEIEAATYMIAAAATGGDLIVENVIPKHLESVSAKLAETGATVDENGDYIRVLGNGRPRPVTLKTLPYPGFPTDAQQQMTTLLTVATGTSLVTETIFEGRFKHVNELKRMGAQILVEGRTAMVEGVDHLTGAAVNATDLRAGAALVVAGLLAEGESEISGVHHIERGYERPVEKLVSIGAVLRRTE
ncbi:MAG: UDP-N-acetylglucosamine 1-carboxyvinyltransferase [Bacillota bacterium]|nr:MAG: UDP-N-acetylglucosamine 1-carboxyvinyltransferase [Bacillota bacterium]